MQELLYTSSEYMNEFMLEYECTPTSDELICMRSMLKDSNIRPVNAAEFYKFIHKYSILTMLNNRVTPFTSFALNKIFILNNSFKEWLARDNNRVITLQHYKTILEDDVVKSKINNLIANHNIQGSGYKNRSKLNGYINYFEVNKINLLHPYICVLNTMLTPRLLRGYYMRCIIKTFGIETLEEHLDERYENAISVEGMFNKTDLQYIAKEELVKLHTLGEESSEIMTVVDKCKLLFNDIYNFFAPLKSYDTSIEEHNFANMFANLYEILDPSYDENTVRIILANMHMIDHNHFLLASNTMCRFASIPCQHHKLLVLDTDTISNNIFENTDTYVLKDRLKELKYAKFENESDVKLLTSRITRPPRIQIASLASTLTYDGGHPSKLIQAYIERKASAIFDRIYNMEHKPTIEINDTGVLVLFGYIPLNNKDNMTIASTFISNITIPTDSAVNTKPIYEACRAYIMNIVDPTELHMYDDNIIVFEVLPCIPFVFKLLHNMNMFYTLYTEAKHINSSSYNNIFTCSCIRNPSLQAVDILCLLYNTAYEYCIDHMNTA